MFATVQISDDRWAAFEFGRPLDPPLTDEAILRRAVRDYERRRDELWDVPMHLAWPILVTLLDEFRFEPQPLSNTIRALGELVWDEPVRHVEPFATNPHRDVRLAAIEALGRMGVYRTVPLVGDALVATDPDIRRAAVIAAGKFGVPGLVIAAAQAARDEPALHPYAIEGAARTRAQLAADSPEIVRALIESSQWQDLHGWIGFHRRDLLELSRRVRTTDTARARMKAILLIQRVRKVGPEAVDYLRDDTIDLETRRQLIIGLGRSRIPPGISGILPYLTHAEPLVQHAAVVALGRIGHPFPWRAIMAQWDAQEGRLRDTIRVAMRRVSAADGAAEVLARTASGGTFAPGHAVFIHDNGTVAHELPREWLHPLLESDDENARRDAVLLLTAFGGPDDATPLRNASRELAPPVRRALDAAAERFSRPAAVAHRFVPWPR